MGLIGVYLLFVLNLGPRWMKNREAYKCDQIVRVYNVVNVAANMVMLYLGLYYTHWLVDCWQDIQVKDMKLSPLAIMCCTYGFMYLKIFDLLDTVFFVLRKKNNQVTALHVIHHAILPITIYMGIKFAPSLPTVVGPVINAFVHIVMYAYYFLASFGDKMRPYLWWKKYITMIQLIQFGILLHNTVYVYFHYPQYSKFLTVLKGMEASYFSYAFTMFYVEAYLPRKSKQGLNKNLAKRK
ncbi:Elongation of very long chain fatty acids protein 1 [Halotydeus destructor]|nr:Elongation of very long chain fatty acids protein 1 [Halotydeus destructor]